MMPSCNCGCNNGRLFKKYGMVTCWFKGVVTQQDSLLAWRDPLHVGSTAEDSGGGFWQMSHGMLEPRES
eukprot:6538201-Ditylum_brightwellii.AAC.1